MKNKLLFIQDLNLFTFFFFVPTYSILGYEIHFLNNKLKNKKLLKRTKLKQVSYEEFRYYDVGNFFHRSAEISNLIYKHLNISDYEPDLANSLNLKDENGKKKLKVCLTSNIQRLIKDLDEIIFCFEYYSKKYNQIKFVINFNIFWSLFLKIKKISPQFILIPKVNLSFTKRVQSLLKYLKKRRGSIRSKQKRKIIPQRSQVMFFPHFGISYANVFLKDYYYDYSNKCGPFHPKNILHIEYQVDKTDKQKSIECDYVKRGYNYYILNDSKKSISTRTFLKVAIETFCLMKKKKPSNIYKTCASFFLLGLTILEFKNWKNDLKSFNTDLAIIGYDALFPKGLALVLHSLTIKTIAAQERFPILFSDNYNVCTDRLLTWGNRVETFIKKSSGASFVGRYVPVGPPRADLIFHVGTDEVNKYIILKAHYQKIAVVFDGSPDTSKDRNKKSILNSWITVKNFLYDVIDLSIKHKDVYFIIRSRYINWTELDFFKPVFKTIKGLKNIEFNNNFSDFHISYQILKISDIVIAQHTSIADEALCYGFPVLFHDYGPSAQKIYATNFSYENLPLFSFSKKSFESMFENILNNGHNLSEKDRLKIQKNYYNNSYDGLVKRRIHKELNNFLNEPRHSS